MGQDGPTIEQNCKWTIPNTAYGSDAAEVTEEVAAERGYEVVATTAHGNGVSDVTPEASKIESADADAVFQASYTPEAILFTRTFRQLDFAPNILAYGAGFSDTAYFEAVGDLGNYTISRGDHPSLCVADGFDHSFRLL